MSRPTDQFEREILAAMPKVRAFAFKLTRDRDQADDLVQDTMVRALAARESFALGTSAAAWMCFIARNQFYSDKRRAWRWAPTPEIRGKDGEELDFFERIPVGPNQHQKLELDDLLEAVSYLPADQRETILLIGEGLSYEEAAAELGTSVGTVKSRACRGRAALEAYFSNPIVEEFA